MSNSPARHKGIIIAVVLVLIILIIVYLTLKPTQTTPKTRSMTLFIWSEYMDPDIISDFERIHNAKVEINYYESNEEMIAKLQTGGLGTYDIIVPSTYFIPALKSLNLIETLDQTRLPNLKNVSTAFRDLEVDPGYHLSVPYQWGTSCMVVRTEDISALEPSWKIFFDKDSNIGNFVLFDTAREALGAALKYLGYSLNSTNIDEIREATELLIQTKSFPTFMGYDSGVGGLNKVMGGVVSAAQVYSGESIRASKEDPQL
ncbi:MAG: spermidine/putrescine ABC transporter substrate-binding protein, partial [Deltaproteobacteria bacterium]|nr:spermidine/putrescine ABC transporter substrate-binding protein [Deltaproteobacteria bacterium]